MRAVIFIHVLYLILIKTFTVKGTAKCDSKVELRAVLLSCPMKDSGCDDDDPLSQAMKAEESQIADTDPRGFEKMKEQKSKEFPNAVKECKRKLVITLKIKNAGKIPCDDEYIVVDHVFDPLTGGRGRLLSPLVIKLRQEQMVQLYGLQFQRVVNSDPFEEQKHSESGCSISPQNPSCGIATYDGKPIPFSEGFCCSRDPHVNAKRQLSPRSSGDSFQHHGSRLTHYKDGYHFDEDKANIIYNPELVKLKPGIPNEVPGSKENDGSEILDVLFGDKIPNFLMEVDRKIICDRGDFMKELCLLRDDNKEATAKADCGGVNDKSKHRVSTGIRDVQFLPRPEIQTPASDNGGAKAALNDLEKNAMELQNFLKSLNVDRVTSPEPVKKKGARGKRENQGENKKLSLEEKLKQFSSSKERATGRRKRLMEISHRRFRKWSERQPYAGDSNYLMDSYKCPPRYFFSHDRAIIDPLESLDTRTNVTYNYMKENLHKYADKGQNCGTLKEDKENRAFLQTSYNENKMNRRDKFFAGKVALRKEKVYDRGRLEKEDVNLKKEEEEGQGDKGRGKNEVAITTREMAKNQNSQFHAKSLRNFLCKSDHDKSKLKHLFSARSKEKEKLEFRRPKPGGFGNQEESEYESTSNELMEKANAGDENVFATPNLQVTNKPMWPQLQYTTESINEIQQPPMGQIYWEQPKILNDEKMYQKTLLNNYDNRIGQSPPGSVNYDIKYMGNKGQELFQRKYYPPFAGQFPEKNRPEIPQRWPGTNTHSLTGKTQKIKQNPFLPYIPSQKYYFHENSKTFPEKHLSKSGSTFRNNPKYLKELRKDLLDPSGRLLQNDLYLNKKPFRGRFFTIQEYPDDNPYSAKWSDKGELQDRHPREKRQPEAPQQKVEPTEKSTCARNKRSASYSFQPAKGFFESDFDSQRSDGLIIHELESCGRRRSCQKYENLSAEAGGILLNSPLDGFAKKNSKLPDKQRLIQSYLNAPEYVLEEIAGVAKGKRDVGEIKKQKSSANECPSFESADIQDTAHCMRYGDLWYGLYVIRKPMVSQLMGIQMFDKHTMGDETEWRELTKGKMIRIGTFLAKAEDDLPTISVTFTGERTGRTKNTIDPDNYFLLIPTHLSDSSKAGFYPQVDGGPSEYMVVPAKDVSSGGDCNRIGTSFEAFARQPDRCSQKKGSCLKRQPVDLWREDMEARIRGKRGKYFVENFGNVANSPIKSYTNLTGEYLALEYYGEYTSTIEIEVKADSNSIIRKGSIGQIPAVYVDSTYPKKTRIILTILNIGLTSANFRPRLGDCPPDLDVAWCPLEGPLVTIAPHQRHDFKLDLSGALPTKEILLTVQVLDQVNKDVAKRKIVIKKDYRCVCAFHCKCNCFGNSKDSRACQKLKLDDYRKAGYTGPYPFRAGSVVSSSKSGNLVENLNIILLVTAVLLLVFGVVKAILGLFIRRIGISGVRVITGPRTLSSYYESELKGCTVLTDDCGYPIHPTTCRPVQIIPLFFEFLLNIVFYFLYPLRGIWYTIGSIACCGSYYMDCDSCCRREETDNDPKSSHPLLSRDPDPTCVQYNLATFNPKKWKQDYLPYPAYKGDDDPLEEDDTEFVLQEMKRYRKK